MKILNIAEELRNNSYPGRGIILGRSADNSKAVIAYFIMGRSVNSRNRIFSVTEDGIRTEAFDPSKMEDPSLTARPSSPTATRPTPSGTPSRRATAIVTVCISAPLSRMTPTTPPESPVWSSPTAATTCLS